MEGNNMKILKKILMVMVMVAMTLTSSSFAAGDYSITVTVDKKYGDVTGKMSLWKVSDKQIPDSEKSTVLGDLNKLSVENLNSTYKNKADVEFSNNEAVFRNLDKGAYYVRDTSGIKRNKEIASVLVNLPDDVENDSKNVTIHAKESSTNVRLVKVDESGNPLKGAKFKLLVRRGSEYVELKNKDTLKKDDKLELSPKDDNRSKVQSEENTDESKDENSKSEKREEKSKEEKTEDKESKDDKSKEDKSSDEGLYISNESGEIIINDIKSGDYIFREVEAPAGYVIKNVDTKFTISDKSVELRVVNSKTREKDKGRHDFMKTDEAKKPLGGAMFKVMTKNKDGKFEPVKKDGKDYVVTSADNGKFAVEDMDYGKYYLVEIKAPEGFILLSEPVEFEIKKQADDKTISIAFITNKSDTITRRKTPGDDITRRRTPGGDITRGRIPKTGDIRFFMSMIGGAIMFFIGKWIIAKDDKLIGKNIK